MNDTAVPLPVPPAISPFRSAASTTTATATTANMNTATKNSNSWDGRPTEPLKKRRGDSANSFWQQQQHSDNNRDTTTTTLQSPHGKLIRQQKGHHRRATTGVILCLFSLVLTFRGMYDPLQAVKSARDTGDASAIQKRNSTKHLAVAADAPPPPAASPTSRPHCIFAENRGWGNSVFAILTFLSEATRVQQSILLRNNIDTMLKGLLLGGGKFPNTNATATTSEGPLLTNTGYVDLRTTYPCIPTSETNNQLYCVDHAFPCIYVEDHDDDNNSKNALSTLGSVYTSLFSNMQACPNKPQFFNVSTCPRRTGQKKNVHELTVARDAIKSNRRYFPELFDLNKTHVEYIFRETGSLVTLDDVLNTDICAMQFRFGDYWFRNNGSDRALRDKRLCKDFDRDMNETSRCFERHAKILLTEACPDPSVPVYLATDWEDFVHYMCDHHQKQREGRDVSGDSGRTDTALERTFVSHCPSGIDTGAETQSSTQQTNDSIIPDNQHIHDVDLASQMGKQILHRMLADWLVLALCKTSPLRKRLLERKAEYNAKLLYANSSETPYSIISYGSTFVETADLQWKVV